MNPTMRVLPLPTGGRADGFGFGVDSCYPPAVWLPVLGPAAYLTWRRLARAAAAADRAPIAIAELAADLGLGSTAGTQSGIARALRRLERFAVARRVNDELLLVAVELPPVPPAQLQRLPVAIRERHARLARRFLDAATG
jgi:hypothetical protein